ncbi:hypothetical protein LFM09_13555 [Lentzea alba]
MKWAFFTLIVGALSMMTDFLVPWITGASADNIDLTARGEPLLISLALVVGGTGELVFDRKSNGLPTLPVGVAMGFSIVFIAIVSICYGALKLADGQQEKIVKMTGETSIIAVERISSISWMALLAAVIISLMCVVLSEMGS